MSGERIDWIPGSPNADGNYWILWEPDQRVELVAVGPAYIHRDNPNANRLMKLIGGIAYQYEPNREHISYYAPIITPTFDRAAEAGARQTALLRGLPLPVDLEAALVRLWQWTQKHGGSVDPVEQGLRAARKQVEHIIGPWMSQNPECSICRRRHGSEVQHACE